MRSIVVALVAPFVLVAGMLLFYINKLQPGAEEPPFPMRETISFSELALPSVSPSFVTGLEQLPASLQGTEVDGSLLADDNGDLIINHDIKRIFDYFLSTLGAESLIDIEQRLRAYIRHQLPAKAAQQAEQLLEDYLALNQALLTLEPTAEVDGDARNPQDTGLLRERLSSIQSLRRQHLPADVIDTFYADDDALDQLALGRMDIMQDRTLSAEQRTQALAELEQSLPSHLQRVMNELNKQQQLSTLTARLRHHGGSDAELYQLRESYYGSDAADRLAQLDQSRQQWQSRMNRWLSDRDNLLAVRGLDAADRQQQIDRLRQEYFEPAELRRVEVLERIHDQAP